MLTTDLLPFIICFAVTVAILPICSRVLTRLGFIDLPDGQRKLQASAIPRSGGIAVLIASGIAIAAACAAGAITAESVHTRFSVPLVGVAVGLMALVGFADDRFQLRGRHKLAGQTLAVALAILGGIRVDLIGLFGYEFDLGLFAYPVTALWLLAAVNAFNLLDGMDGMAGCISTLICLTIAGLAAAGGHAFVAVVALTLAGGLLGFLVYNLPPARVYLGDCGSLTVGFLISILAVEGSVKGATTVTLAVPVVLLALPIMDTVCAVLRRVLTGRSIFTADRGHLHHCLQQNGWSVRASLVLVSGLTLVLSGGAFLSVAMQNEAVALVAAAGVVALLVYGRLFGSSELVLTRQRVVGGVRRMLRTQNSGSWEMALRLQGTSDRWIELWKAVSADAERFQVDSVCLDVNAPRYHESFYARRENTIGSGPSSGRWLVELPIRLHGTDIGRLRVSSRAGSTAVVLSVETFGKTIERFERTFEAERRQQSDAAGQQWSTPPRGPDLPLAAATL